VSRRREELAAGLRQVERRIEAACAAAGRDPAAITLVVVTKTYPVGDLRELCGLGVRDLGESREQELATKHEALADEPLARDVRWHFIGRLQSNKARAVGATADLVHSVDRTALLDPLGRGAHQAGRPVGVLVQVSLDGDPRRGGVLPAQAPALADEVAATEGLVLRGVMAVAPQDVDPVQAFAVLPHLLERLRAAHVQADVISAGMSGDLEAAVTVGATHLRVGSAVLGARSPLG
jgi:PLP dependent protein